MSRAAVKYKKIISIFSLAALFLSGCGNTVNTQSSKTVLNADNAGSQNSITDSSADDENSDELYDSTPISNAYITGNADALDSYQLEILSEAAEIIDSIIDESMSDYEKELAVHDYIVANCEYDTGLLSVFGAYGKYSSDPYGALLKGKAICSGYTTTFQLFMDMLEIPCISLKAGDTDGEEHAWNMVQINDEWYYVDVTWDDPIPDRGADDFIRHKYFNVTEDYMAKKHLWDTQDLPEATNFKDSYIEHNIYTISDFAQTQEYIETQISNKSENVYFRLDDELKSSVSTMDSEDDIDTVYFAKDISDDLADVFDNILNKHKNIKLRCQRIEYDREIIFAVYIGSK